MATLLNPLEKLMASNFTLVENGKEIDPSKSPRELNLQNNAKIMVYGSLSKKIENAISSGPLRFFKRFRDSRGDGWYIGRDRWDAVTFIPKRDVRILGVGIFEPYPAARKDFKYGYKYVLKDTDDTEIETSSVFEDDVQCPPAEEIDDHIMKHPFVNGPPGGIKVKQG